MTGRAIVRWQPNSNFDLDLAIDGTYQRQNSAAQTLAYLNPSTAYIGLYNAKVAIPVYGQALGTQFVPSNPYTSYATGPSKDDLDVFGVSATATWNLGDWYLGSTELKSISAYRTMDNSVDDNVASVPLPFFYSTFASNAHQFSEELQLTGSADGGRARWIVGMFALNEHNDYTFVDHVLGGLYAAIGLDAGYEIPGVVDNTSVAVYGEATVPLLDCLSATLGIRYTSDEKGLTTSNSGPESHALVLAPTHESHTWTGASPRAILQYQATDADMLYLSYSEGFRSGGYNGRATSLTMLAPYNPEYVDAYELRFKSEPLGNWLRLNGDVYWDSYRTFRLR